MTTLTPNMMTEQWNQSPEHFEQLGQQFVRHLRGHLDDDVGDEHGRL